jgi:hypothetical protein
MAKPGAVLALRLIAAQAAKLADDLERSRLWEGQLDDGLQAIGKALSDAMAEARNA